MLKKTIALLALAGTTLALPVHADTATDTQPATTTRTAAEHAHKPLLTPAELLPLLARADVRILDIRAPKDYAEGHIPGAVNTPYGAFRGPRDNAGQLVPEAALTELLRKAGIDEGTQVVIVHGGADHTDFGAAARVYWTLKVGGLARLSILDGGTKSWAGGGGALDKATPVVTPSQFSYRYDQNQIVTSEELAAELRSSSAPLLVDARPPRFFNGEARVDAAARYGTLPGARSFDNAQFFVKGGTTLKPADELKALVAQAGAAAAPAVSFCNTGHWAATNWFVMSEIAGNTAARLYPASVVEWSKAELPMDNQPSRVTALIQDVKRSFE
ncbi:sulfurtransferase [Thauera linaloolentis]|uniref:Rhodanese n=1 Tax=Thauera linaloolentis (strain DSM 12138 / JCM 21573 / CCUG 41526 / CIP 105981 / IAM 15112 / NBRC 102519 / 47Lol) TaxID=1123367 RepID=N6XTZ7_THAL4|nr:rhodanese-like domain-containing protein [Thauera linaloolentis]ENO85226.1 rhodanese [Thauera linaloolentis 47Lol = DSM 12138]MCM8565103.1 rhodanese-like domain-containing protein [Thauera linaloolentis]